LPIVQQNPKKIFKVWKEYVDSQRLGIGRREYVNKKRKYLEDPPRIPKKSAQELICTRRYWK